MAVPLGGPAPALIDPHGGRPTSTRAWCGSLRPDAFVEDPSRLVRAARYAARLGFALEPGTEAAAADRGAAARPGGRLAWREELRRLLEEEDAAPGALRCWATSASPGSPATPALAVAALDAARRPAGVPRTSPGGRCGSARRSSPARPARCSRCPGGRARPRGRPPRGVVLAQALGAGAAALRDRPGAAERAARERRSAPWRTAPEAVARWWAQRPRPRPARCDGSDLVAAGVAPGPAIGQGACGRAGRRARRRVGRPGRSSCTWPCASPGRTRERRGDPDRHRRPGRGRRSAPAGAG